MRALAGTDRPLIVTSGTGVAHTPGRLTTEEDAPNSPFPRVASEEAAAAVAAKGVRVSVMRLPQVHDPVKQGLITYLIAVAREKGVSAYVGDGLNRWPAAHRLDAARLYGWRWKRRPKRILREAVITRWQKRACRCERSLRSIGRGLKVPVVSKSREEAADHFGWIAAFFAVSTAPLPAR